MRGAVAAGGGGRQGAGLPALRSPDCSGWPLRTPKPARHLSFHRAQILNQFGEQPADMVERQKYASWRAAEINKAIREGRAPAPPPETAKAEQARASRACLCPPLPSFGAEGCLFLCGFHWELLQPLRTCAPPRRS